MKKERPYRCYHTVLIKPTVYSKYWFCANCRKNFKAKKEKHA